MKKNVINELNELFLKFIELGQKYASSIGEGDKNLTVDQSSAVKVCRDLVTSKIPAALSRLLESDKFRCNGSIGQGRIASTPWIAVKDKELFDRKDGIVKAYIVFFLSTSIDSVYVTLSVQASDFSNTGKAQLATISKFAEAAELQVPIDSPYFIESEELDIRNETFKSCSIYQAKWNLQDPSHNISVLEDLLGAYEKLCTIQKSDNPILPDYSATTHRPRRSNIDVTNKTSDNSNDNQSRAIIPMQKIFFGTPGGGKSHKVKHIIEEEKGAKDRCFRTTFHPDTDYASFVGSYKPVMKDELICYKYIPQVFTLAYIAAWNDLDNEFFLDIEEINRGNCAQIFGDLFQLLDRNADGYSEYPIQADSDLADFLLNGKNADGNDVLVNKAGIKQKKLCLPPNLSIVATMNTSDQSLFPMDSAFKRRWDWEYVPSTFKEEDNFNITLGNKVYKWHTFLREVNAHIKQSTESEDKQMGAYFIKSDLNEEQFKSKVMYYLWCEICKDEYKTQNNFFRFNDKENKQQEFTFNELYSKDSTVILQKFMKFMKVKPVVGDDTNDEEYADSEQ